MIHQKSYLIRVKESVLVDRTSEYIIKANCREDIEKHFIVGALTEKIPLTIEEGQIIEEWEQEENKKIKEVLFIIEQK